jgi:putative transposase
LNHSVIVFRQFVLLPQSTKLNGHIERAQRTHAEEFFDLYIRDLGLKSLIGALREWKTFHNTAQPHHSLNLRTQAEYLRECCLGLAPFDQMPHMS